MWGGFFFQAEDGIRDLVRSRGLGDVYKRQLLYPLKINQLYKDWRYVAFLIIMAVSMINEDTIESQAGITYYVFFSLFLYLLSIEKETMNNFP